jgi:hypothetical protein
MLFIRDRSSKMFVVIDSTDLFLLFTILSFFVWNTYFNRQEKKLKNLAESSKKNDKNLSYRGGSEIEVIKLSIREQIILRLQQKYNAILRSLPISAQRFITNLVNYLKKKRAIEIILPLIVQKSEELSISDAGVQSFIVIKNVIIVTNNPGAPALGAILGTFFATFMKKSLSWILTVLGTFFLTRCYYQNQIQQAVNNETHADEVKIYADEVNELNSRLSVCEPERPIKKQLQMSSSEIPENKIPTNKIPSEKEFIDVQEFEATQEALDATKAAMKQRHIVNSGKAAALKKNRYNTMSKYEYEIESPQEFNETIKNDLKFKN